MRTRLSNTAIAFGVFAAIYSVLFGLFFGFFLNVIIAIIEAAAKTDGTWTAVFMFGGIAVILLGVVNVVGCIFARRRPLVTGIIFASTGGIYLLYVVLVLAKLFAPAFLAFIAPGLAFYAIAIATAFAAYRLDRKAHLLQALDLAMEGQRAETDSSAQAEAQVAAIEEPSEEQNPSEE